MKAVLLAAGKGTRLQPLTNEISKQMIPIAGKPFLEYIIEDVVKCGFDDICIVTGHLENQIKEYFKAKKLDAKIHFVTQKEYKGTADATRYTRDFVGKDSFLLYLSDTIIPRLQNHVKEMTKSESEIDILTAKVPDTQIQSAGSIETNNGYVTKLSEKSQHPKSDLAWTGVALLKNDYIFKIIQNMKPSSREEYEITDAMNQALQHKKIKNHICDRYIDSGTPTGMIDATKFILSQSTDVSKQNKTECEFSIIKPTYIGNNCVIGENTAIGPFVSIGNNVIIGNNVKLEESLILDDVTIESNQHIRKSIISKGYTLY